MQIIVIRHGESSYNKLHLCNDDPQKPVHLTEIGRQQANSVAAELANENFDIVFSSELPRARETAAIIVQSQPHIPLLISPALNDIITGFDGKPVSDYFLAGGTNRLHHSPVIGAESWLAYAQRVRHFLAWLDQQSWNKVVLVAHEETLRVFAHHYQQLPAEDAINLAFANATPHFL